MQNIDSPYKGSASLTREQFLFYEVRTTAKLLQEGLSSEDAIKKITEENLFQYPTEKAIKKIAQGCIRRLEAMDSDELVQAIANEPSDVSKQICLYAMMKQYRLMWDFMITVIGTKYRQQDFTFSRRDLNAFFLQLQEQDDLVASWSETTIKKMVSVISRVLVETEYIDHAKSLTLNPVLISRILENSLRESGDTLALLAFNCLD